MKRLATALFVLLSFSSGAQTLFHHGDDSVSVQEFLTAYQKNNTGVNTEKAFREYLTLYIHSRLKVKEAKARGYDTLPQLVIDLDGLRQQIIPNYLTDKEEVGRLVKEAFERSQKNIRLAHIFISSSDDVEESRAKAEAAMKELQSGKDFADVARRYSNDPSVSANGGDLGWITAFSLPYELENIAYATPVGQVSSLHRSKAGYHILKNLGERKDAGKMKAAQTLLAIPPGASEVVRKEIKNRADSIYNRIIKGDDFGKLAEQFSNDAVSAAAHGQMQDFGTGQYDAAFEEAAFGISKDGEVSKPFLTAHGYHIVKRLGKTAAVAKATEKILEDFQTRVEQSDRINVTRQALAAKILRSHLKKENFDAKELYAYSDSVLNFVRPVEELKYNGHATLFRIGEQGYTVGDWTAYAQTFRYKADGSGLKPYPVLWEEFVEAMALNYYQAHLEEFNESFKQQLAEFRDGNLFFEIMQREVWGPAQTDSIGPANYFRMNQARYHWKPSADAVIFYATDLAAAKTFSEQLKKSPRSWSTLVNNFSEHIAADSSRFELTQIPNPSKLSLKPGVITGMQINQADNTASFAYIIRNHNNTSPRTFAEARGLVITDYQNELEKKWMDALKAKYPVKVNENVLGELITKKRY